jgi:hypothetical protein
MSRSFWVPRKFAGISFALSLLEIAVFLVAILLVRRPGVEVTIILRIVLTNWLFVGTGSAIFALVGLIADTRKAAAIGALLAAIGTWLLCGSPIMFM